MAPVEPGGLLARMSSCPRHRSKRSSSAQHEALPFRLPLNLVDLGENASTRLRVRVGAIGDPYNAAV